MRTVGRGWSTVGQSLLGQRTDVCCLLACYWLAAEPRIVGSEAPLVIFFLEVEADTLPMHVVLSCQSGH